MPVKKLGLKPKRISFFDQVSEHERPRLERMLNALPPGTIDGTIDSTPIDRMEPDATLIYDVILDKIVGREHDINGVSIYPHGRTTHFWGINIPKGARDAYMFIRTYLRDPRDPKSANAIIVQFVYNNTEYLVSTRPWEQDPFDANQLALSHRIRRGAATIPIVLL